MLVDANTWLNDLNCSTNLGSDNAYRSLLALVACKALPRLYMEGERHHRPML